MSETHDHIARCIRVVENTAQRLGVDPVAFAEACQDGSFLYEAVLLAGNKRPLTVAESQILDRWLDKLAALKRASDDDTPGGQNILSAG